MSSCKLFFIRNERGIICTRRTHSPSCLMRFVLFVVWPFTFVHCIICPPNNCRTFRPTEEYIFNSFSITREWSFSLSFYLSQRNVIRFLYRNFIGNLLNITLYDVIDSYSSKVDAIPEHIYLSFPIKLNTAVFLDIPLWIIKTLQSIKLWNIYLIKSMK